MIKTDRIIVYSYFRGWTDQETHEEIIPQAGDRIDVIWSCFNWKSALPDSLEYIQDGTYALLKESK